MCAASIASSVARPLPGAAFAVQERQGDRRELGRLEDLVVSEVGEDREPVLRHVFAHPARVSEPAAEELIELTMCSGRNMSPSPKTSITGIVSLLTSVDQS